MELFLLLANHLREVKADPNSGQNQPDLSLLIGSAFGSGSEWVEVLTSVIGVVD